VKCEVLETEVAQVKALSNELLALNNDLQTLNKELKGDALVRGVQLQTLQAQVAEQQARADVQEKKHQRIVAACQRETLRLRSLLAAAEEERDATSRELAHAQDAAVESERVRRRESEEMRGREREKERARECERQEERVRDEHRERERKVYLFSRSTLSSDFT
jgi:hypothetical protein